VAEANEPFFSDEGFYQWFLARESSFRRRYRQDLAAIASRAGIGRLLDVGCGCGVFLDEARAAGWQVAGVEAAAKAAEIARSRFGLDVRVGTLEKLDLPRESFDAITFFDVLEHLPDPLATLQHARVLLRPNGVLVAQSPNFASVMRCLLGERWRWYFLPNHLHHFTPRTLRHLLAACGLVVERVSTFDIPEEFAANLCEGAALGRPRLFRHAAVRRAVRLLVRTGSPAWSRIGFGGLIRAFARRVEP
jgi:SAM-dependent methyltransferase